MRSHLGVGGPTTPFRGDPGDILAWIFDVASLAMDTILRIDLKPFTALVIDDLIDSGWTVALGRFLPAAQVDTERDVFIGKLQVHGLIFFVGGVGQKY